MNKVDFHSHILPGIDDGSQSEMQSYEMLKLEKAHGVDKVIVTPHFYPDDLSPKEFVERRQASYNKLIDYIDQKCQKRNFPPSFKVQKCYLEWKRLT